MFFDTEVLERNRETGRQRVLLGILPRASATEILARVRNAGVEPLTLAAQPAGGGLKDASHFDFLAVMQDSPDEARAQRRLLLWWGGVAALVAANLFIAIYRDTDKTQALQNAVDVQQGRVAVALHLRQKVTSESARRRDRPEAAGALRAAAHARCGIRRPAERYLGRAFSSGMAKPCGFQGL